MAENSEISWTDHTANFWWGCVKVSALCDHCYAETWTNRYGGDFTNRRRFIKSVWNELPKWDAIAKKTGERKRVFVMSMGDFFENLPEPHEDYDEMVRVRCQAINLMRSCTNLDFLVLTKRISNVKNMVPMAWLMGYWPSHIRLGISVGTQKDADRDIPRLLEIDAPNFLSMEPLLEEVRLRGIWLPGMGQRRCLEWIVAGGESGPQARPSHPDWFRLLRDQCAEAHIPFHFKQWGDLLPYEHTSPPFLRDQRGIEHDGHGLDIIDPETGDMGKGWHEDSLHCDCAWKRVGKKTAGRLLDGKLHDGYPAVLV